MSEPLEELSEKGLLAAQRDLSRIIGSGDAQAFARFLHPNFIINGPQNICGGRDQILRLSKGGAFARENSRNQIESTAITGNIGILMGNEVVTPADGSLLAEWFGTEPLRLRFTDIYVFENGRWLCLARQASVVREARKFRG
jgi:hypothetical protein